MAEKNELMDKIVSLAKRRGFIYPGSEIYGGLANTYDYGPLGTELLRNIKNLWWKYFVQDRSDMVGLDASIISHSRVWQASGHVAGFADAMIDCKNCKARMRADHLLEDKIVQDASIESGIPLDQFMTGVQADSRLTDDEKTLFSQVAKTGKVEGLSVELLNKLVELIKPKCPNCGKFDWTAIRKFNLLFPVQLGIVEGEGGMGYLRGETAQGIFINFKNVVDSTRVRLPFGIAQLGKSFRNEITPGNSIFRTIEFEQGEIEYFFDHNTNNWEELFEKWKNSMWDFATKYLGVSAENLRWRAHTDEERSFYSTKTEDMEYKFPFGFKELWGLAYRTDYDLQKHGEASKKDLTITDPYSGQKIMPHVIEPAVGINRLLLMVLVDAYTEQGTSAGGEEGKRVVLNLHPRLAPYKVAVFPLLANKENLVEKAKGIYDELKKHFMVTFDARGNIGKRYLYQDEIGTPWCVTVDFDTIEDDAVTVRDRITTKQERVAIKDLPTYFASKLG
ncbi:glycine--tRNA ligase [Candidatus Roizmanbacteria bacterium]|nr:glycine--tRNA ligase [Candidatus Roizmanbacteria bacterium]